VDQVRGGKDQGNWVARGEDDRTLTDSSTVVLFIPIEMTPEPKAAVVVFPIQFVHFVNQISDYGVFKIPTLLGIAVHNQSTVNADSHPVTTKLLSLIDNVR
jgi:hypothetical protein